MRIEHAGIQVAEPGAMGDWYVKHLGFTIKRAAESPVPVRFIADASGKVMLEIYNNPKVPPPDLFQDGSALPAYRVHLRRRAGHDEAPDRGRRHPARPDREYASRG